MFKIIIPAIVAGLIAIGNLTAATAQASPPSQIKEKTIRIGDTEIAYYTRGSGKPLILLNGFKATMSTWDPALLEILETKYQLVLFDRRGFGRSTDVQDNKITVKQMAEDAAELVKALGFNKVFVLGWSMGARIGQQLAIHYPDLVEKLILCAPNPGGKYRVTASWKISQNLNSAEQTQNQLFEMLFPQNVLGKSSELAYKSRIFQAVANGKAPDGLVINEKAIAKEREALELWNKSDENYENLSKIKAPTLLTDGKEDVIDPPENTRLIANRIPYSWTAYFDGGHAFLFQEYQRFAELVLLFLDGENHPS